MLDFGVALVYQVITFENDVELQIAVNIYRT